MLMISAKLPLPPTLSDSHLWDLERELSTSSKALVLTLWERRPLQVPVPALSFVQCYCSALKREGACMCLILPYSGHSRCMYGGQSFKICGSPGKTKKKISMAKFQEVPGLVGSWCRAGPKPSV